MNQTCVSLAIETSSRVGGVALGVGGQIVRSDTFSATMRHAVELLPTLDRICQHENIAPTEVSEIYVSAGPGSFTGLRIGITVARTLAWTLGTRVVRVPTLDVVAQNARRVTDPPKHLCVVLDAKRNRVYAAVFDRQVDRYVRQTDPAEWDPVELFANLTPDTAIMGEGVPYISEQIRHSNLRILPDESFPALAHSVHELGHSAARQGRFDDPAKLIPIYVRRPEAEEIWERRHRQP